MEPGHRPNSLPLARGELGCSRPQPGSLPWHRGEHGGSGLWAGARERLAEKTRPASLYPPAASVDALGSWASSVPGGTALGDTLGCGGNGVDTILPLWCANKGTLTADQGSSSQHTFTGIITLGSYNPRGEG